MSYTPEELRQYLIGGLPEVRSDEIELQIISGELSEEDLLITENDLIEDYLEDNLSFAESELFQKNFLISPERESQISQISLLKDYAKKSKTSKVAAITKDSEESGFFRKLAASLSISPVKAVFALLIVGVFVGIVWFIIYKNSSNGNFSALEREFAKINQSDLSNIEKPDTFSRINLASGNFRSADSKNKLHNESFTDKVLVNIALPQEFDSSDGFRIELLNDGKTVFTQHIDRAYQNPNGEEIRLFVPQKVLQKGNYHLIVKNPTPKNADLKYGFSIN